MADVLLTALDVRDADEMFRLLSASEIYEEMEEVPPASIEALRRRYEFLSKQSSPDGTEWWLNWIVRNAETNEAMGFVQATVVKAKGSAAIAYVLHPRFWGKGYARMAVANMLEILRMTYKVKEFVATVNESNTASVKLLKHFSFKETSRTPIEGGKIELAFCLK